MKVVGNIVEVLTKDLQVVEGSCKSCALRLQRSGKLDCMLPYGIECPLEDNKCYKHK